jgi:hypothetical protein
MNNVWELRIIPEIMQILFEKSKKLIAGRRAWVPDALWKPRPARFAYKNTQNLSRDDAGNEVLAALIHFAVIVRSN